MRKAVSALRPVIIGLGFKLYTISRFVYVVFAVDQCLPQRQLYLKSCENRIILQKLGFGIEFAAFKDGNSTARRLFVSS